MKISNLLLAATAGYIIYRLTKKNTVSMQGPKKPGTVSKFFNRLAEDIGKPIDEVDNELARSGSTTYNPQA